MKQLLLILSMLLLSVCSPHETDHNTNALEMCGQYDNTGLYIAQEEVLDHKLKIIKIAPDSSYKWKSDEVKGVDNLNSFFDNGHPHIRFSLESVDILIDPNIISKPVNFKNYLNHLNEEGHIIQVVFPDETIFTDEVVNGAKTRHFNGAALFIGSNTYFVRDSSVETMTNAHEIGHCFTLLHPFQGPDTSHKGFSCATGDYVGDTANPEKNLTEEELRIIQLNLMAYSENRLTITKIQGDKMRKHVEIDIASHSGKYHTLKRGSAVKVDYAKMLYDY